MDPEKINKYYFIFNNFLKKFLRIIVISFICSFFAIKIKSVNSVTNYTIINAQIEYKYCKIIKEKMYVVANLWLCYYNRQFTKLFTIFKKKKKNKKKKN